jgi:GTP-binding protein
MIIQTAEFLISAVNREQFPTSLLPEFAFIGRSNVGKSSLINMLLNRKLLARTSGKPGKTRTLNFFCVNNKWNLVDMPGYGYALASKTDREIFAKIIQEYIHHRKNLLWLFILIDSRHKPLQTDIDFIEQCAQMQMPFAIVFTKTDKSGKTELDSNLAAYQKRLYETFEELPPVFKASSVNKTGREQLLSFIFSQAELYADEIRNMSK